MSSILHRLTFLGIITLAITTPLAHASGDMFGVSEHIALGNTIKLFFSPDDTGHTDHQFHLPNGVSLSYGDVISFGDFYEISGKPITKGKTLGERRERFLADFSSFTIDTAVVSEEEKILAIGRHELEIVAARIQQGEKPEDIYKKISNEMGRQFNCATGGGCGTHTWWLSPGRFLTLEKDNYDHFGDSAWETYQIGHQLALEEAIIAQQTHDTGKLELAYVMNAFACHFLSDRFSSGHMRVPRDELPQHSSPAITGSLLAGYMHNEENMYGLHVYNQRGDRWVAYGDWYYFSSQNSTAKNLLQETLQASADQIFAAYLHASIPADTINTLIPQADETGNKNNHDLSPMFYWDSQTDKVLRRKDLSNPYDRHWTDSWWGWSTLLELREQKGMTLKAQAELALSDQAAQARQDGLMTDNYLLQY